MNGEGRGANLEQESTGGPPGWTGVQSTQWYKGLEERGGVKGQRTWEELGAGGGRGRGAGDGKS